MKNDKFILAIDQGTTGSRAILYSHRGAVAASAYQEYPQYYPKPGWVEHNAVEILRSVDSVIRTALKTARADSRQIAAIGITNQRETTVLWNCRTGRPVHRAIVWQDRRTSQFCASLKERKKEKMVREKTGLVLDPYFSATKVRWILNHLPGIKRQAFRGDILFGTIDTWLLWNLTGRNSHITDFTNASRTLLFNIHQKKWDEDLIRLFSVPRKILPKVQDSASLFGKTVKREGLAAGIPIYSMIGDQQAALYGQDCVRNGDAKNTYGTGCFVMTNVGHRKMKPIPGLLTTLACDAKGRCSYALEGAVFIGGAVVQWLRDGLHLFKAARESEKLIHGLTDTGGITLIPAFSGLGSPYWNPDVRGMISGITRGTTKAHLIRAALESIAQQSADVIERIQQSAHVQIRSLKVDGGATANHFLMQFQADLLGVPIRVSSISEATAWGAAKLAAKASGFWPVSKNLGLVRYKSYLPRMRRIKSRQLRAIWAREIKRLLSI